VVDLDIFCNKPLSRSTYVSKICDGLHGIIRQDSCHSKYKHGFSFFHTSTANFSRLKAV
jgi:hypothetical protein